MYCRSNEKKKGKKENLNSPNLIGGLVLRDWTTNKTWFDFVFGWARRGVKCDADQRSSRLVLKPPVCPLQSRFVARHHQRNKDTANQEGENGCFSFTPELRAANWLTAFKLSRAKNTENRNRLQALPFSQSFHFYNQRPSVKMKLQKTLVIPAK